MKKAETNKFSYKTREGKRMGYFNIYQAKNGKIYLQMGDSITELQFSQINQLNIFLYDLPDFDHDEYLKAYSDSLLDVIR